MDTDLQKRIQSAELQIKVLRIACTVQLLLLLVTVTTVLFIRSVWAASSSDVLHVRGLVIEDAQGRPSVLLGAPFANVDARRRQDEGSAAMLFLNENGADRLLIGEGIATQIDGKIYSQQQRAVQGSGYGVTIMDGSGNERCGFGFTALSTGGGRATISLDRAIGDAWGALVDDKTGWAGMIFNYPMPTGEYQPGIEMGVLSERPFLHFKDKKDNSRAEISIAPDGVPSLTVYDAKGKPLTDLFHSQHH